MNDDADGTNPVQDISEAECWDLLRSHEFARLAFHLVNEVTITPINYVVDDQYIVTRTAEGNKLVGVTMNSDVALEIDEIGEESAWSVIVHGTARVLDGAEARAAEALPLRSWVPTSKSLTIAIKPDSVTGRKFRLSKPAGPA